jgi:hypothetical protein
MKLNLFHRTTLGIALLLGLLLLCMATALLGLSRLHADTRQLADVEVAKVDHASQAALMLSQVERDLSRILTREDKAAYARFKAGQNERRASLSHHFSELQRLSYRPDSQALLAQVQTRRQTLLAALGQITPLLDADDYAGARALYAQSGEAALSAYLQAVDSYLALQKRVLAEHSAAASQTVAQFELWLQLIGGVSLLLAIAVGVWLVRGVKRPLGGDPGVVSEALSRIAQGDLASQTPSGRAIRTACWPGWAACATACANWWAIFRAPAAKSPAPRVICPPAARKLPQARWSKARPPRRWPARWKNWAAISPAWRNRRAGCWTWPPARKTWPAKATACWAKPLAKSAR